MDVNGSVIAVTGGSRGFGLEIARVLCERGAQVGLIARNRERLDAAVQTLGAERALGVAADAGDRQSGIGREMGPEGFEEYLETKTIALGAA